MQGLKEWIVKRSGAAMTIRGLDTDGKTVKVVGVARIQPTWVQGFPAVVATTTDGRTFRLHAKPE